MRKKNIRFKTLLKTNGLFHKSEPWINIFLLKYLTVYITFLVLNFTNLKPNHLSIISLTLGMISCLWFITGNQIVGASFYFVSYLFDAVDGKLARVLKLSSLQGAIIDALVDRLVIIFLSLSLVYYTNNIISDGNISLQMITFLGLYFLGFDFFLYKKKNKKNFWKNTYLKKYLNFIKKKGVVSSPISLPEIIFLIFIISPIINKTSEILYFCIFFLIIRVILKFPFRLK